MLSYIMRGFLSVAAVLYTVISIGLSYADIQKAPDTADAVSLTITEDNEKSKAAVHILQSREEIGFELQQALDLYSKTLSEKPQFTVQTIGSESDYNTTLRASLLAGNGADLFHISGSRELTELEKYVCELDFLSWITKAYPGSLEAVTRNDRIYGVPYSVEAAGFICNRGIFEDAGISLPDIQSFEALSEAFLKLNDKIQSGQLSEDFSQLEAVCEFAAQDKNFLAGELADVALSGAFGSPAEAAISSTVKFPAAGPVEELVKLVARYSADKSDWSKLAEITKANQTERFAQGKVAVILDDTNAYRRVNELNPKMRGRTFLLPVPLYTFEQPSIYAGVPVYWAINASSDGKSKSFTGGFLTWLYRTDEGCECLADSFTAVSPFRDTAKDTGVALHNQMLSYLEAGMSLPCFSRELPKGWGKDIFAPNLQNYFTQREKTWDDVINACESGWPG